MAPNVVRFTIDLPTNCELKVIGFTGPEWQRFANNRIEAARPNFLGILRRNVYLVKFPAVEASPE
jgi:hypothetical protein